MVHLWHIYTIENCMHVNIVKLHVTMQLQHPKNVEEQIQISLYYIIACTCVCYVCIFVCVVSHIIMYSVWTHPQQTGRFSPCRYSE